ncbi:hypothetical protein ACJX0J_025120, partial [Zea mays]
MLYYQLVDALDNENVVAQDAPIVIFSPIVNGAFIIEGNSEPSNYSKSITSANYNNWITTMQDNLWSLIKNGILSVVLGIDFNDIFSSIRLYAKTTYLYENEVCILDRP